MQNDHKKVGIEDSFKYIVKLNVMLFRNNLRQKKLKKMFEKGYKPLFFKGFYQ